MPFPQKSYIWRVKEDKNWGFIINALLNFVFCHSFVSPDDGEPKRRREIISILILSLNNFVKFSKVCKVVLTWSSSFSGG